MTDLLEDRVLARVVANELASGDEVAAARAQAQHRGLAPTALLVEAGVVTDDQVVALRAAELGLPHVFPYASALDETLLEAYPEEVLRRHAALPLAVQEGAVVVAFAEAPDTAAVRELEARGGRPVRAVLAGAERLRRALDAHFGSPRRAAVERRGAVPESSALVLLYGHLARARREGATEVRFDLAGGELVVRHRAGGLLVERERADAALLPVIAGRVAMLAGHRALLPAAFAATLRTRLGGDEVALGLSAIPTPSGPSVLVRIDAEGPAPALSPAAVRIASLRRGLVVVAGAEPAARRRVACELARLAGPRARATLARLLEPAPLDPAVIALADGALPAALRHAPDVLVFEPAPRDGAAPLLPAAADRALVLVVVDAPDAIEGVAGLLEEGASPSRLARVLAALVTEREGRVEAVEVPRALRDAIEDRACARALRAAGGA